VEGLPRRRVTEIERLIESRSRSRPIWR
jgi:hypothetical protein